MAQHLRHLVKADVEKTAANAVAAIVQALLPAIKNLGPKVLELAKLIPPDVWGKIAMAVATMISQAATAKKTASVYDPSTVVVDTIAAVDKKLAAVGVPNSDVVATYVVLAAAQAVENHINTPNRRLVSAVCQVQMVQNEVAFLRKFV